MLRVILVGLLFGAVLGLGVGAAPATRADPQTCPPTCDQIPDTAWPGPGSLPMSNTQRWPDLSRIAVPAADPRFTFEELCARAPVPGDAREYAVAARATVHRPEGQWQLRAQVLHWRGETWQGGQLAAQVFDDAVAALRGCQAGAPQFSPSITTLEPGRLAAVISGPQVVRQYLIADVHNSTVVELALWIDQAGQDASAAPWPGVADGRVLDAIASPLCAAYLASCG